MNSSWKSNKTGFRKTNFATTPSFNEKIVLIVLEREGNKRTKETEIRTWCNEKEENSHSTQ